MEEWKAGQLSGQERNRVLKKKTRFRHHGNSIAVANRSLDCSAQPTDCRIDIESQKDVTGTIVGNPDGNSVSMDTKESV